MLPVLQLSFLLVCWISIIEFFPRMNEKREKNIIAPNTPLVVYELGRLPGGAFARAFVYGWTPPTPPPPVSRAAQPPGARSRRGGSNTARAWWPLAYFGGEAGLGWGLGREHCALHSSPRAQR